MDFDICRNPICQQATLSKQGQYVTQCVPAIHNQIHIKYISFNYEAIAVGGTI